MSIPKWLDIAYKEIGTQELSDGDNSRIVEYHATTTLKAIKDEVPWCSSFVNWCMVKSGLAGTGSALAASWLTWGVAINNPIVGCVCIIKSAVKNDSKTGTATGFHVGFWLAEDNVTIQLLGGNQSNSVKKSNFSKISYTILGYRIPKEVANGTVHME